jgi:uncharacterized protein with PIN domain
MMRTDDPRAIYYDSSAIVALLFKDKDSDELQRSVHRERIDLVSSLARAEPRKVIA